jgi:cobalamin biosynthetic protein CobC
MAVLEHGGGLTAAARRYGGDPADWLDLSTGINPNMPVLPEIPASIWNRLPDSALVQSARQAARDWYLCHAASVRSEALPLAVPGTQSFIQVLPTLVPPNRPMAILSPTYGEYAHCCARAGIVVDRITGLEQLRPDHGALVVVNPNNPDGRVQSRAQLRDLYARMRQQGGHLHVDEAFGDSRPELSLADVALTSVGLTVSRSFGKFFGLAGIRLGFVFAVPEILDRIDAALGPWAVSGPALHLAGDLMRRDRQPIVVALTRRRAGLQGSLDRAGLTVVGGTDLFALVAHENAAGLFEHLAASHILVRKFDYAPQWLRIGLAPDELGDGRLADTLASF